MPVIRQKLLWCLLIIWNNLQNNVPPHYVWCSPRGSIQFATLVYNLKAAHLKAMLSLYYNPDDQLLILDFRCVR